MTFYKNAISTYQIILFYQNSFLVLSLCKYFFQMVLRSKNTCYWTIISRLAVLPDGTVKRRRSNSVY
jgi:hypothetical protein